MTREQHVLFLAGRHASVRLSLAPPDWRNSTMEPNLMDTVKGMITPEVVQQTAGRTGESPEAAQKALHGAIPTVFAGLTHASSTPVGASRIFEAITRKGGSPKELVGNVFGDRSDAVGSALEQHADLKSGTGSHVLSAVVPMVMGVIGSHALSNRMTPDGVSRMLSKEGNATRSDSNTPDGLASALGGAGMGGAASVAAERFHREEAVRRDQSVMREESVRREEPVRSERMRADVGSGSESIHRNRSPWRAIFPALAIAALIVWALSSAFRTHGPNIGVTARQPQAPVLQPPPAPATPNQQVGHLVLPGGESLDVTPGGGEAQLAGALGDSSVGLPRAFSFGDLHFATGSAAIPPDGAKTIDGLATILGAYPGARVRIVGRTDDIGSQAGNQSLSESRATAIKDALVKSGVSSDRIETAGVAARHPVLGSSAEDASNRSAILLLLNR